MDAVTEFPPRYPAIALEVVGPAAMFTRPDTGVTPISYPVPTYSAAKGMFEAVSWRSRVYIRPSRVEICSPIRYERYITNYGGPLRKLDQIRRNNNYQLIATILVDVHYRIYAEVQGKKRSGTRDHAKELWERFNERLTNGQTYYTPCLGWKEFVPSYFGPLQERDENGNNIEPDKTVNVVIPSLLHSMWERRKLQPTFRQNVEIKEGVMIYE
jgi:CRISPR-associated protein Cas5d